MRKFFAEKQHDSAKFRNHTLQFNVGLRVVKHQFPTLPCLPVAIEIRHQRQSAIGVAAKSVHMGFVESPHVINRQMALKGKQTEK